MSSINTALCRALIVLLLMISGNVDVHPSTVASSNADLCSDNSFTYLRSLKSLAFHVNIKSSLSKMDRLKVWVHSSNTDVLVITEMWLIKERCFEH